jgi:dinuclear metal center YbgI/SA1388 family protein
MTRVKDIEQYFAKTVPYSMKESFDNVGLLAGFTENAVTRVLVSLDITSEVVAEAESLGAELVVSHHPLTFGLKSVTDGDTTGAVIAGLLQGNMSAICLHTNLDSAAGGVNDVLIGTIGASCLGILDEPRENELGFYGIGRYGELPEQTDMAHFLPKLKAALNTNGLRYHDAGKPVHRVAVCGGSGGEYLERALELGCDTYLTADIKYDRFLAAKALGVNLIDGDHFCTENLVVPVLAEKIRAAFPELEVTVSQTHGQTAQFYV